MKYPTAPAPMISAQGMDLRIDAMSDAAVKLTCPVVSSTVMVPSP